MKTSSRFIFKDGQQKSGCKASFAFRFALRRELNQFTLVQSRQNEEISMAELFTFGCSRLFGLQDQLYRSKDELFKSLFWVIDFMWSQYYQNLF